MTSGLSLARDISEQTHDSVLVRDLRLVVRVSPYGCHRTTLACQASFIRARTLPLLLMTVPPLHPALLQYLRKMQGSTRVGVHTLRQEDAGRCARTVFRWQR